MPLVIVDVASEPLVIPKLTEIRKPCSLETMVMVAVLL